LTAWRHAVCESRRAKQMMAQLNPFKKGKVPVDLLPFEVPLYDLDKRIEEVRSQVEDTDSALSEQIEAIQAIQALERRAAGLRHDTFARLTPQQRCQVPPPSCTMHPCIHAPCIMHHASMHPCIMHPCIHAPCIMQPSCPTVGISGGRSLTRPLRDARRFPSTRL
jgi:hypothetical protein